MKTYQKAELIAKNLPSGSYAAGCPVERREGYNVYRGNTNYQGACHVCELAS